MLPGVLHCAGGTGPDDVDWVLLIRDWVEKNKAPERVVLSKIVNGKTVMTRPFFLILKRRFTMEAVMPILKKTSVRKRSKHGS
jgi:hypothetical protein